MARLNLGKGMDEYLRQLERATINSRHIVGMCVYDGAGKVADEMRRQINNLPVDEEYHEPGEMRNGIRKAAKTGLLNGFGISRIHDDGGFYNVKLGFSGRNSVRTPKYPTGQPNSVIARSINSGTSFMRGTHFVQKAINASRGAAEQAIEDKLNEELQKIFGS